MLNNVYKTAAYSPELLLAKRDCNAISRTSLTPHLEGKPSGYQGALGLPVSKRRQQEGAGQLLKADQR